MFFSLKLATSLVILLIVIVVTLLTQYNAIIGNSTITNTTGMDSNDSDRVKKCFDSGGQYRDYISATNIPIHYNKLLNITERYRNVYSRSDATAVSSLIEKMFIDTFISYNLSFFSGMIPLFVEWSDYTRKFNIHNQNQKELFKPLLCQLRPDIIYIVVSQSNNGLEFLDRAYPNILQLSSGGEGHIALPLLKGFALPIQPIGEHFPKYNLSFYGSSYHGNGRKRIVDCLQKRIGHHLNLDLNIVIGFLNNWKDEAALSSLNLAPEGYGRGTYRLSEIIQMGRVPVLTYKDEPWIPYRGSNISVEYIGIITKSSDKGAEELINVMKSLKLSRVFEMIERVQLARYYYTIEGVLEQMKLFFTDPLGPNGGALCCKRRSSYIRNELYLLGEQQNL